MLRHDTIWDAIDRLARDRGLTASALARRAGLDPTTFNRSKRVSRDGKPRWPSTESVAKILEATGASLSEFVTLMDGAARWPMAVPVRNLPLVRLSQMGAPGRFDESGRLAGADDEIPFPGLADTEAYAVEVDGSDLEPLYRDGDRLVISPTAELRRGDRVVLRRTDGRIQFRRLLRRTARRIEVGALTEIDRPLHELASDDVTWLARILWASQ